jgi:glycosyltransferase involved in cell wall biosynthesis
MTTVLYLANSAQIGGGNRSLLLLNRGLHLRGNEACVVVPQKGQMLNVCLAENVAFVIRSFQQPSWRFPRETWLSYLNWKRLLYESGASLVHANDVSTARSVSLAAWRSGIPVFCHVRFPPGKPVIDWAFRRLPKPAAFIFNSHAMQAECGPDFALACPSSKQFVIHNAVDLQQFQPRPKQSPRRRVGILANLLPVKGHNDYLRMARLLTERGIDAEHWLIGEDIHETGYRAELERLRCELGLCEAVRFLGHREDVPDLLNELDVLVCASHVEPFGRCLIEAMACEKPVVATRVGGIPEVVEDGVTGILVPPESPEQLADAVARLLNDPELCVTMGKVGRQRVETLFTPEAHTEAVLAVYRSVLNS